MRETAMAVALSLLAVVPVAAAEVDSPFGSGLVFRASDVAAISEATKPFFQKEAAEPGSQRSWSNAMSGLSGTARYEGANAMGGRACRQVRHIIRNAETDRTYEYRVDRCLGADGTWTIAAAAWMAN